MVYMDVAKKDDISQRAPEGLSEELEFLHTFQPIVLTSDQSLGHGIELFSRPVVGGKQLPIEQVLLSLQKTDELQYLDRKMLESIANLLLGDDKNYFKKFINISTEDVFLSVKPEMFPNPSQIVIELTEHFPIGNIKRVSEHAQLLKKSGIELAIDDFGSGFSNLKLILELSPHYVKLDKYFISRIDQHPEKEKMVKTFECFISGLHEIDIKVICEGIEDVQHLDLANSIGVDYIQGYFIARPAAILRE
jgi:EAL domain-containing protein (putative c-di-GMP-specific phosphodiesterase class I)